MFTDPTCQPLENGNGALIANDLMPPCEGAGESRYQVVILKTDALVTNNTVINKITGFSEVH